MSKISVELPDGKTYKYIYESGLLYDELILNLVPDKDLKTQIENILNLDIRENDVYLATFPKSGTHWVWEILGMLKNGRSTYDTKTKQSATLDFQSPELIGNITSPRILNCHYPCKLTPKGVFNKGVKIVHVMRNPKDVIVSCYYHMKIMAGELFQLSFQEFLPLMIGDYGTYFFYPWFKYVKEWERFSKKHPDQILNIYFEDLKEDSVREIKKMDTFLGTGQTDDVIKEIAEACRFKNMKKADAEVKLPEEFMIKAGRPCLYRLGEVGDWKNHFTLEQNEQVDKWIEENLVETELSFKYTL